MRAQRAILFAFPLVLLSLWSYSDAQAQLWSEVLAPARATDWTRAGAVPGSPGSLPSANWTQCGTTLPAGSYNGSTISSTLGRCSANTYYLLGPGTFNINGSIQMPGGPGGGRRALRGSGQSTILSFTGSLGGCNGTGADICISGDGTYPGGPVTAYNWTGGYAQGATQITLSSVSKIVPNQTLLILNQCDTGFSGTNCTSGASVDNGNYFVCSTLYDSGTGQGCGANGPDTGAWSPRQNDFQQEIVMVTAINQGGCGSTCVTISDPLIHPNWSSSQSPQAVLVQPAIQVGIENLTIDGSASSGNQTGIGAQDTWEMWVSGVEIHDTYEFAIYDLVEAHTTVKDSYFFRSNGHPDAYAVRTTNAELDLIQNNIFQQWKNSFAHDGPGVGTVIAYNYSVDQIVPGPSDQMWGAYWTHSAGDDYMLREGNAADQAQDDNVHGTHLNQTSLRNFYWGFESCINGATGGSNCGSSPVKDQASTAFIESSGVRYANNVGNVLGTPGFTTTYQTVAPFGGFAVWNIGGGNGTVGLPTDNLVGSTMLRWGNWDSVNAAALFCTGKNTPIPACPEDDRGQSAPLYPGLTNPNTDLPASFYLNAKPAWFSSTAWPAVGADVSGGNVGQCGGTINGMAMAGLPATGSSQCTSGSIKMGAWAGHVNAIPAMNCYLNVMGGRPDGTGGALQFDSNTCYPGSGDPPPAPPTGLSAVVQ